MLMLAQIPTWLVGVLVALFVVASAMLILVVLVQKPQGGGLSEAFGASGGSGNTAFGAKTGDALTTATIGMFVVFILFAVGLNYVVRPPAAVDEAAISADPNAPVETPVGSGVTNTTTSTTTVPAGTVEVLPPATTTPEAPASTPASAPTATPAAPTSEAPAPAPAPAGGEQPKNPQ